MELKTKFIPINKQDLIENDWEAVDIILISGDAYIDHPAFGVPLLARYLVNKGFRVGIIAQPQKDEDYQVLGRPNLFFGISSGNVDSMVNHYTAQRKIRSEDDFSPNGKTGLRPDRAVLVYTQKVKQFFKDITVVIGGIESSMRRIPHYDFMSDKVRNSILIDSKATILVYGSGERQLLEIATNMKNKKDFEEIRGICQVIKNKPVGGVLLPINDETFLNKEVNKQSDTEQNNKNSESHFYKMTKTFIDNYQTKTLYYEFNNRFFVHYPPAEALSTAELDDVYNLPFTREPHPIYKGKFIKAFEQIRFSVLSHRGCYGGCSFCVLGFHQGKTIQSRSKDSIIKEIRKIAEKNYFRGTISDIAGASANMYGTFCKARLSQSCPKQSCLFPDICKNLNISEKPYLSILKTAKSLSKIKNVFVSSGVRFDLALKQQDFIQELACFYTSGSLKLAPEHVNEKVLKKMHKPAIEKYLDFSKIFFDISKKIEKKQYIIPYLIVGFPGSTLEDAVELAIFLKKNHLQVEQIQEFTPTPMTIATMMYWTGIDYETQENIYVPKGREIKLQKALAQWYVKTNKKLVLEALKRVNRIDLIDFFL
ncbi:MAG: YgiQ family radical SAM protein [Candidatus Cloacimonetes bacterium]|nr:YgiQ family radical SAM protein [Candidatus Cloacimonadota bacterium]